MSLIEVGGKEGYYIDRVGGVVRLCLSRNPLQMLLVNWRRWFGVVANDNIVILYHF